MVRWDFADKTLKESERRFSLDLSDEIRISACYPSQFAVVAEASARIYYYDGKAGGNWKKVVKIGAELQSKALVSTIRRSAIQPAA